MTKRSVKNITLCLIFVIYMFLYKLIIFPNFMKYSEIMNASFVISLLALSIFFLGFRKDKVTNLEKSVIKIVIFYLCLTFFIMYGLGLVIGFLKNGYSLSFFTLLDNIFAPILIIISCELFRYVVIWANRDKKIFVWIFTALLILFEVCISTKGIPFGDIEAMFRLAATVILPIIVKNVALTYFCYHLGYRVPLIYRLVMDVYIFVVPIVPDIGEYVESMILLSLPFLMYLSTYAMIDDKIQRQEAIFYKSGFTLWDIPVAVLLITLICLISGFFPHYMIGIGSDSMSPKINKGDAVIIEKLRKGIHLKKNDIIAYSKDGRLVVHRIVEINGHSYITKGDANGGNDPKAVKEKQIKGIVRLKIPFIAYPTVWLSELIHD